MPRQLNTKQLVDRDFRSLPVAKKVIGKEILTKAFKKIFSYNEPRKSARPKTHPPVARTEVGVKTMIDAILRSKQTPTSARKFAINMEGILNVYGNLKGQQLPALTEIYQQWCRKPYGVHK